MERYIDCVTENAEERCDDEDAEWLEATINLYIVPQAEQFYDCDFGKFLHYKAVGACNHVNQSENFSSISPQRNHKVP